AGGLSDALERVEVAAPLVLPLLNGLDHVELLRARLDAQSVVAGTIRVEADNPQPGVVVHTSRFLLVEMASRFENAREPMALLAQALVGAGVSARGDRPISPHSEATVMWSKLVRLNALACTTSAYDKLLGEIRDTPALRADLQGAIVEASAVAQLEGAEEVSAEKAIEELERAHDSLGSSMQRDIAAGRAPELDAIPGSVLRAGERHGVQCPTIERLVGMIRRRVEAAAS
ncbi:MAG: ketopantoate reductase family protein, partial [Solirubrobacteraceae bacterium]